MSEKREDSMSIRPVAYEASVKIEDPDDDDEARAGLAAAIVEAARAAAANIAVDEEATFEVSSIRIGVKGNPGPTSYSVVVTQHSGGGS